MRAKSSSRNVLVWYSYLFSFRVVLTQEVTVPRSAPYCSALPYQCQLHYRIYLPVMLSRLAFSIMAPKSTLACGGAGRGDTDMALEATVILVC